MKFSVFSVCLPEYDVAETIKVMKDMGYDGIEWRVSEPCPAEKPEDYTFEWRYWTYNKSCLDIATIEEDAAKVKAMCDEAGLGICNLATYLYVDQPEEIERVMKAAKIMGCPKMRINAPEYDETENYNVVFNRTKEQLKVVEKLAEKYGVAVNIETHMGNIIPSASAAYRLVCDCDPRYVGVLFDPGNMVYEGFENYRMGIELLGKYLNHVHVKNSIWKLTETSEAGVEKYEPTFAQFWKGYADLGKLLQVLRDVGYDGFVSVEDFSNVEDTVTKLQNNLAYLKTL